MSIECGKLQGFGDEDQYLSWEPPVKKSPAEELFGNPYSLRRSLDTHLDILNQGLTECFKNYLARGKFDMPCSSFRFHTAEGCDYYEDAEIDGEPALDGDFSVLLSTHLLSSDKPRIVSVVGMMHGRRLPWFLRGRDVRLPDDGTNLVAIVQLQGQAQRTAYEIKEIGKTFVKECPEAKVLQRIPWVDFFVQDVVRPWATHIGADALGIVSSGAIAAKHPQIPAVRFQRRYDDTAQRHGFTMHPGGVHLLSLR